jgi:hypothetical protein
MQRMACIVSLIALGAMSLLGQSRPASIAGAWRIVEVTTTGPNARTIKNPQPSLYIFTAKHFSLMQVTGEKPRPTIAQADIEKASADQLRALWGPFTARTGTYEAKDGSLTTRQIVTKNPDGMRDGATFTYSYKLDGNTLLLTLKSSPGGPAANPSTLKLTRLE